MTDDKKRNFMQSVSDQIFQDVNRQPDDIWAAVGKSIKGFGGGRYRLNREFLFWEKGIARTDSQQVRVAFVTDVQMHQSMVQRARGVGTVTVTVTHPSGQVEVIELENVPEPGSVKQIILQTANEARNLERMRDQTAYYQGQPPAMFQGMKPQAAQPQYSQQPVSAPPQEQPKQENASNDPMVQLQKLGDLLKAGLITEEDYAAKKQEILARM
ncbi:PH domain-containing protein [uncultured Varibaculum sp.]|uniref:SHOCT domain-containing protein n=1 Tax=uncultured Varibaculum sp. TaxID=413896 RepID=UPI0027D9A1F5|nr:PH domain-containing protein [uncultured Varibaculum sp.]